MNKKIKEALVIIYCAGACLLSAYGQMEPLPLDRVPEASKSKTSTPPINNHNTRSAPGSIHTHSVGIGLGETFLAGKFRDYGDDSITFDGFYTYSASYSFDLLINAHYSKHEHLDEYASMEGVVVGIKAKLYQFDAFSPYIVGGPGFYRPKVKRYVSTSDSPSPHLLESDGKVAFGMNIGAGADLKLNDMLSIGLIAHYHDPFNVKQNTGPEVTGSYFKLLMTLMYNL